MSKSVLIIEDAVFIRELEKRILRNIGFEIVGETNEEAEGLVLFKQTNPDLVIVDLQLTEGSGINAMRKMLELNPDVRLIVATSHSGMLESQAADLKSRVQAILLKPFSEDELTAALQDAVR